MFYNNIVNFRNFELVELVETTYLSILIDLQPFLFLEDGTFRLLFKKKKTTSNTIKNWYGGSYNKKILH